MSPRERAEIKKIPFEGVPERQRGGGMLVRLLANLFINPINIPFPFSNSQQASKTPHRINSIGLVRRTPSVSST